jgi:hypothetical protein
MAQNIRILALIHFLIYFHNNVKGRTEHNGAVEKVKITANKEKNNTKTKYCGIITALWQDTNKRIIPRDNL